ncbi:hypothetical protein Tco_0369694 [Tanacetum coccineum]
METKNTSSSGSVLEEPEIQKLQMQAKIFKENSLNKLNALKSTTQLLEKQSILYQQAALHNSLVIEMRFRNPSSVIKVQFERFINSDLLKPLDIYSRSFSSDREKEQVMSKSLKDTLKKLSERQLQIQQCKVQEVQSSVTSSGDETSSGIVSNEEIDKQELEAHYGFMAKIQEVLPAQSSSTDTPLEHVQNNDEKNVFANVRRHSEQPAAECLMSVLRLLI